MVNGIYAPSVLEGPLRQGEILGNLTQVRPKLETIGKSEIEVVLQVHPYAIIVSQDCDLDLDHQTRMGTKQDKLIPNILFCEVVPATVMRNSGMQSNIWDRIKINKDERYQFLQQVAAKEDALQEGIPELGVDFKRYFTIPADELYARIAANEAKRRCCLVSPYLEHFSTRFAYYQFRIALPSEHFSEPAEKK